jgi:hypothetical protein
MWLEFEILPIKEGAFCVHKWASNFPHVKIFHHVIIHLSLCVQQWVIILSHKLLDKNNNFDHKVIIYFTMINKYIHLSLSGGWWILIYL